MQSGNITFNKEVHAAYFAFATSGNAAWPVNFCDLSASIARTATLSPNDRINEEVVRDEMGCLRRMWRKAEYIGKDADRLRKYLVRFGLDWELIRTMP